MRKLLFIVLFFPLLANARKFYFSSSLGNDSYDTIQAQNSATPWKTLRKLQQQVVNGVNTFTAGDTIAFKRGDFFDNGYNSYASMTWCNYGTHDTYFTAPSGTQSAPIVFTNYGDVNLPLPNFVHPNASYYPAGTSKHVFQIEGVNWIVIDGLQFNDTRFPYADKRNPAYSQSGILLGHWIQSSSSSVLGACSNPDNRWRFVNNCVVKNCNFSNMGFGLGELSGTNILIDNNTFTNFKSTPDTIGFTDVMGGAMEAVSGYNVTITNNYIKGAWAGSGRVSDSYGLGGVGIDMFWSLKNSKIAYNTFIDCSGMFEMGNRDNLDSCNGAQYDTFAYNKIINCGQMGYLHGTQGDIFKANNHNLYVWNNVVISNNKDRMWGNGFGDDIYSDGQGFSQFWFFRSKYKCPDAFDINGGTVAGSTTITFASTVGLQIGTQLYDADEVAYRTITNIGTGQVTVDIPMNVTNTNYQFIAYAPITDLSWSYPTNVPLCNASGGRSVIQYAGDVTAWGMGYDTLIDSRNNIFYSTNGGSMIYDASRTRYKHRNNIYYTKGGFGIPTALGGTLGIGEFQTITNLFADTTASFAENWNLLPSSGSLSISAGTPISGLTKDFAGNTVTNPPSIGLYNFSNPLPTNTLRIRKKFINKN